MKTFNVNPDLTIDQNDQVNAGKEIQFYTTAPKEYDWGWTKELNADTGYRNKKKEVFRFIVVADKYHADMQKGRYHSGLYECLEVHEFAVYEDKEREEKKPCRLVIIRDALLGRHKSLRSRDSGLFMPEEEFAMKLAKQIDNQLKKYERR